MAGTMLGPWDGARRSCDYRSYCRKDAESSYADSDCSVGFRRISSDFDRYSYRVALGTCRRKSFPRWSLFVFYRFANTRSMRWWERVTGGR